MVCPKCNMASAEGQKYCGECGSYLLSDAIMDERLLNDRIEAVLAKQLKDREVVEVAITENIVGKIASWAKLFAYFIGIPLAIALFTLGFLGYNSYSSFTTLIENTEKKIKPQIEQAKARVDTLNEIGRASC